MQAVITHPGGIAAGIASPAAQDAIAIDAEELDAVILPSQKLTSAERLAIYNRAYYARLIDCLREQYPVLTATMGDEAFAQIALHYLQAHPPHSYTLSPLGDKLADFLAATRPDATTSDVAWPDVLIDLARLEWAINDVFDAPGVEGQPLMSRETLEQIPAAQWPAVSLNPVPSLRLLSLRFALNDYYTAIRRQEEVPLPRAEETFLALVRRDYIVRRHPLSRTQFTLLSALVEGEPIGAAIQRALSGESVDVDDATWANRLKEWFTAWTRAGFFLSVGEPPPSLT